LLKEMDRMATPPKPSTLIKPTLDTRFHIDYDWWERNPGEDLRIYLLSHLSPEQRERLSQSPEGSVVDYIDPETGEVFPLDELHLALRVAAEDPNFLSSNVSLVDCVFRALIKNNNVPLSAREIEALTGRSADTIVRTLTRGQIYKGIRPYMGG
jgi:hypothetical protein